MFLGVLGLGFRFSYFTGLCQCGREVPVVKLAVAERLLTGTVPFDEQFQGILDGLVEGLGLPYP